MCQQSLLLDPERHLQDLQHSLSLPATINVPFCKTTDMCKLYISKLFFSLIFHLDVVIVLCLWSG